MSSFHKRTLVDIESVVTDEKILALAYGPVKEKTHKEITVRYCGKAV